MRTVPAREIKRCGMSVVDAALKEGPVHVIKNDVPSYVVLTVEHYRDLVEAHQEASLARLRASLADVEAGRVRRFSGVDELMAAIDEPDE